uniref:DUF4434 domain-containing protein n=1 Tax=Candidatus Electrothrix sp. TaxID=2170559 RepID=UPI004055CD93
MKDIVLRQTAAFFLNVFFIANIAVQANAGEPRIHGFFVQPYLGYGATNHERFSSQAEYDQWLQSMADTGVEMLFYQWTVHYEKTPEWYNTVDPDSPEAADFAFYNPTAAVINDIPTQGWVTPTDWPGSPNKGGKEPVRYLLDAAQKVGIKVWLGLYLNEDNNSPYSWWNAVTDSTISPEDEKAIEHHVDRSIAVVNDLTGQYGQHSALGGFYYSIELANNAFLPSGNHPYLASILDRVAQAVHTALPGKQLALSPFFNTDLSEAEPFGEMLKYALQNSGLDILILQDGVGVDPHTLTATKDQVTAYFAAARQAADAAGKPFWGNVEIFTNLGTRADPQLRSTSMEKLRLQLETIAPFVDKIVSFEFHYMDPNDAYTFYKPLGGTAETDRAMRQELYDSYQTYWQEWQNQRSRAALPAIFGMLSGEK